MDEQILFMKLILSYFYTGFNFFFILGIIISFFRSTKESTKQLKIRLFFLIIIDAAQYITFALDLDIFIGELYYELLLCVINSVLVYLFISIYKIFINLIKLNGIDNINKSMPSYQYAFIAFFLILPFTQLLNFESKIFIFLQNIVIICVVYRFYKHLFKPVSFIFKSLNKQYTEEKQIMKNLKVLLNMSFHFIFFKILMNIIFLFFVEEYYRDLLSTPMNFITYLKYCVYTLLIIIIMRMDEVKIEKNIYYDDDALNKLKEKNGANKF